VDNATGYLTYHCWWTSKYQTFTSRRYWHWSQGAWPHCSNRQDM